MRPVTATKQQKYTSTEAGLGYRKVNREVRKKMKAAKEEWIKEVQEHREEYDVRKQQGSLQNPQGSHQDPTALVIEDSSGNILTEGTAVLNRWTEYCSGLYNYKLHPDTSLLQSN